MNNLNNLDVNGCVLVYVYYVMYVTNMIRVFFYVCLKNGNTPIWILDGSQLAVGSLKKP